MNTITVQVVGRAWVARYPDDDEVTQMMGTPCVETAFLAGMPGETVKAKIQALNPEYQVLLA